MMNKELEALDILRDMTFEQNAFSQERNDAIEIIEKALTPPTEEEVCKALSEHLGEKIVFEGFSLHNIDRSKGVCVFNPRTKEIEMIVELPPHLITMIGRFYSTLKASD